MTLPTEQQKAKALAEMPSPKMQTCLAPNWYVKHYATIKALLSPASPQIDRWQPIETYRGGTVLVSKPTDRYIYSATTAFYDVCDTWRVFRSEGGMKELSFDPTHWMPLPTPPTEENE